MSVNASSTFSSFLHRPFVNYCMNAYIAFNASRVILLLLPFSILILFLGFQKWRQQHSFRTASHSDFFAYHLAAMELIGVLGWCCLLRANTVVVAGIAVVGRYLASVSFHGEILFHILTCAERYLAVVHPVIYMGLKNTRGVRIRNFSIGCVWVLCCVLVNVFFIDQNNIELFCLLAVTIIVTCYCTVSVLYVLIRPGPGEKERVDQSKQRAFNTIIAISAALWLWFVGILVAFSVRGSRLLTSDEFCLVTMIVSFLNLPSSVVSPLLYLHRAGKLTSSCCSRE